MKWIFNNNIQRPKVDIRRQMLPITNVISSLPWNPDRKWGRRPTSKIDSVIVHQIGRLPGIDKPCTMEDVNTYHITPSFDRDGDGTIENWERNHLTDKGAPHICYHFAIARSGQIFQTNRVTDVTWHCKRWNTRAIGVLVEGDFDGPNWEGTEVPTANQNRNLKRLLRILGKRYNIASENMKGHGETNALKEACPGNIIMKILENFRKG